MKKIFVCLVLMFIGYAMNAQDLMVRSNSPLNKDSKIVKVLEFKQHVQGVSTIDMNGTDGVALNKRTDATSSLKREKTSKEVIFGKASASESKITYILDGVPVFLTAISPNKQYVGGNIYWSDGFYWTDEDGEIFVNPSEIAAINDDGLLVGTFFNGEYTEWDEAIYVGGYYNGEWNQLPMDQACGISEDGTKIAGCILGENWDWLPVMWSDGEITALDYENFGQGARVLSMSADGRVITAWAAPNYERKPAIWVDGEYKRITHNGLWLNGEPTGVSANGKYVALSFGREAALYDVEKDELTKIGYFPHSWGGAYGTAVSNDGIVVGYNQVGMMMDREGFIYHEKWGMIDLREYLFSIGIPEAIYADLAVPLGISADGKRIIGFSSELDGWIVDIEEHKSGLYRPKNLTLTEIGFGNVEISWDAPSEDPENTFKGYNLYCNDIKLNGSLLTTASYLDDQFQQGKYSYYVTAVWNDDEETGPSNVAKINIGKISLPFMEDFGTGSLDDNYWNVSPGAETRWVITEWGGIPPPAVIYAVPTDSKYNEYLMSPYIDAVDTEQLFLAFNLGLASAAMTGIINDTLKVEVYDGEEWHKIIEFLPSLEYVYSFEYHEFDISEYAAGKETRIRFVGYGKNDKDNMIWNIDNIYIFGSEDAIELLEPVRVTAHTMDDGFVHVNWADPGNVASLSYFEYDGLYNFIGNEGVPFIAGAKFESKDLIGYNGYKLVSVSALLTYLEDMNNCATYKLAIFLDNERIVDQDINSESINFYDWTTFTLDEPIIISIDLVETLYFGIEVVTHIISDFPVGLCEMPGEWEEIGQWEYLFTPYYDGRSNLYSEDGGQTWGALTKFDIDGSVAVRANLVNDDDALPIERLLGYMVFRNDENITGVDQYTGQNKLTVMNNFTDFNPLDEEDVCYSVVAVYNIQKGSEKATFCLGDPVNIDKVFANNKNVFEIYPNPAYDFIYIYGENFSQATLYDFRGTVIMQTTNKDISINNLSSGIYLLKVESKDGKSMIQKVVKR